MPEWLRLVRDFAMALGAALLAALVTSAVHADLNTILAVGIGVCVVMFVSTEVYAARKRRRSIPGQTSARALATGGPALPAPPVGIRLLPEQDVITNQFRLGLLNRGEVSRYRAEVIAITDQDGREPAITRTRWPVPWLVDNTVASKDVPMFSRPTLNFAHFMLTRLREDLEGTKWLNGDHWIFPTLPEPVGVSYSPVRTWDEQDRHFFVVTVRIIRDAPTGHTDTRFRLGTKGGELYCREIAEEPATVLSSDLAVQPVPDRLSIQVTPEPQWTSFGEGAYLVAFGVVIENTTDRPIDVRNMWVAGGLGDRQGLGMEVREALDRQRDQMREGVGPLLLRPGTVRPGSPVVGLLVEEFLVAGRGQQPHCTFALMDAGGNTYAAEIHGAPEEVAQPSPGSAT